MDRKLVIFSALCLCYAFVETSRSRRALGELIINIKGFDNCTSEGKGLFRWTNTKMKFGRNSQAVFSGQLHLGFPVMNNGSTPVRMSTYFLQNGGYKLLFKSDTKSIFDLLHRLSPQLLEGLMKCFRNTDNYFPPGVHNCTNWYMQPIKKQLPISIKSKGFVTIEFYRDSTLMGCFKMLLDIN